MNALHLIMATLESVSDSPLINALKPVIPGLHRATNVGDGLPAGAEAYACRFPIAIVLFPGYLGQHPLNRTYGDILVIASRGDEHGNAQICWVPEKDFQLFVRETRVAMRALAMLQLHGMGGKGVDARRDAMHECYAAWRRWIDATGKSGMSALWSLVAEIAEA